MSKHKIITRLDPNLGKCWEVNDKYAIYSDGIIYRLDGIEREIPLYVFEIKSKLLPKEKGKTREIERKEYQELESKGYDLERVTGEYSVWVLYDWYRGILYDRVIYRGTK